MRTTWEYNIDDRKFDLALQAVDTIAYGGQEIPVWRIVAGTEDVNFYAGKFIRFEDLPAELQPEFREWQRHAPGPLHGAVYELDCLLFLEGRQ